MLCLVGQSVSEALFLLVFTNSLHLIPFFRPEMSQKRRKDSCTHTDTHSPTSCPRMLVLLFQNLFTYLTLTCRSYRFPVITGYRITQHLCFVLLTWHGNQVCLKKSSEVKQITWIAWLTVANKGPNAIFAYSIVLTRRWFTLINLCFTFQA